MPQFAFTVCCGAGCKPWETCAPPPACECKLPSRAWAGLFGQGCTSNSGNRANASTVEAGAEVAAPKLVARIEVQIIGAERVRRMLGGRPIVAVAGIVKVDIRPVACSRKENAIAIDLARELASLNTI